MAQRQSKRQDARGIESGHGDRIIAPSLGQVPLEHLPRWDGQNHILAMSVSVSAKGDVQEQMLFAEYLTKWLVGMVAGWIDETVVNNVILVLIGEQGSYKTTWFNYLLPPELRQYFYTKTNASRMGRDDLLTLAQYGLVCCEELDTMNARELNQLKAAVTMPSIDERAAYAHFHEHRKHIASFCGSGNQQRFLSDDTGNRRWLCFKVSHIDDPRTWGIDYDQLYAQLRDEWRRGFRYWFDLDEQRIVERQNQHFRIESDEEQLIRSRLRPPHVGEKITLMNAASIAQYINGGVVGRGLSSRKVSLAMGRLGFKSVHTKAGNFFEVYQIPANEIQPTLAYVDENAENAPSMPTMTEGDLPF